jgi:hypothetical protein
LIDETEYALVTASLDAEWRQIKAEIIIRFFIDSQPLRSAVLLLDHKTEAFVGRGKLEIDDITYLLPVY